MTTSFLQPPAVQAAMEAELMLKRREMRRLEQIIERQVALPRFGHR